MLNRRILRIKAFKEVFAAKLSGQTELRISLNELKQSLEATRDLYILMMGLVPALADAADERIRRASKKIVKSEEELNPNYKFARNHISASMAADPDFKKIFKKKGFDWSYNDIFVRKLFAEICTRDYFKEYMGNPSSSREEDCELFIRIFENELVDREDLEVMLEDMNIYWNDDLAYSLSWCCRSLIDIKKGKLWQLPDLFLSDGKPGMEDDQKFVTLLFEKAFANYDEYLKIVSGIIPNWDKDRLVGTDIALIITAMAEIDTFPEIPVNVTINEYVEISKYYGTARSSVFVNGILDKISKMDKFKKF